MTELSREILANWQVRKTKKQKTAFIQFLQQKLPQLQVEKSFLGRNLVLGDVKTAKVILTAHYDTCARLPFPNFITPKNFLVFIGYQILVALPFLLVFFGLLAGLPMLGMPFMAAYWLSFIAMMGLMLWIFNFGKPNPHTANDNTSGVITLCEIWAALPDAARSQVCIIFFDNEENGLLGSSAYASAHRKDGLKEKLLLNFDCVSDGDHMLFVINKPAMKRYGEQLKAAFPSTEDKTVHMESSSRAIYPSDQGNFPVNAAVSAMNYRKGIGLYMDKIHTPKDTVFQEENIAFLKEGVLRFLSSL